MWGCVSLGNGAKPFLNSHFKEPICKQGNWEGIVDICIYNLCKDSENYHLSTLTEVVVICKIINHVTCYEFECSHWLKYAVISTNERDRICKRSHGL